MAGFIYDFGFDFNAVQAANTLSKLRFGLLGLGGAQPLVVLSKDDKIKFNVFNLTADATVSSHSIIGGVFTFTDAQTIPRSQPSPNPFSSDTIFFSNGRSASITTVNGSATFQIGFFGMAQRMAPSAIFVSSPQWPSWEITSDITPPSIGGNAGQFSLTVALIVQPPSSSNSPQPVVQRTFVVDPEMIVEAHPGSLVT